MRMRWIGLAVAGMVALACMSGEPEPDVVAVAPEPEPEPVVVAPTPDPAPAAAPAADPVARLAAMELHEQYAEVCAIAWEPYVGVLRGAAGTLEARAGNAVDQATLLVTTLERKGFDARIAQGSLDDATVTRMLDAWVGTPGAGYDAGLMALAREHTWVEVMLDGDWMALDPVLGTEIGAAPAKATAHAEGPAADAFQQLTFTLKIETAGGKIATHGPFGGPVAALDRGLTVLATAEPLVEGPAKPKPADASPMGGLGGGLGGGLRGDAPKPAPAADPGLAAAPERVGTRWTWSLDLDGKPQTALVDERDADPGSRVVREWLEVTLAVPGDAPRTWERELGAGDAPGWRRYDVAILRGPVARAAVEADVAAMDVAGWKTRAASLADDEATAASVDDGRKLATATGAVGQLAARMFAAESDAASAKAAAAFGVGLTHPEPRVLIVSQQTGWEGDDAVQTEVTLDLRIDAVGAWPLPGTAAGAVRAFHGARGVAESALEGAIVELLTGSPALTTARVMAAAGTAGVGVVVATPDNRSALDAVTVDPADRARIEAALGAGRQVAVLERPVDVDGAPHTGWWDIDPTTGQFVGVLAGGQHQAMVQYTVTLEEIAVNDDMGFVLGLLVGATGSQVLIAAKMLEYGEITEQAKEEIRAIIGNMLCHVCPSAEVSGSAGVSVGADCYEIWSAGVSIGVGASIAFCDNYQKGVECAMAVMLEGVGSQAPGVDAGGGFTESYPWSCD